MASRRLKGLVSGRLWARCGCGVDTEVTELEVDELGNAAARCPCGMDLLREESDGCIVLHGLTALVGEGSEQASEDKK